jgi:hypothetical protein
MSSSMTTQGRNLFPDDISFCPSRTDNMIAPEIVRDGSYYPVSIQKRGILVEVKAREKFYHRLGTGPKAILHFKTQCNIFAQSTIRRPVSKFT